MSSLRTVIYVLGGVAAVSLALLMISAFGLTGDIRTLVTWIFWISFIALLIALYLGYRRTPGSEEVEIEGPGFARFLFNNRAAGLFWLPIRIFVGVSFLDAGLHKLSDPGWTQGGASLLAYWQRAAAIPEAPARPAITYDWYRDFINFLINGHHETWFAWLVTLGEMAVGLGLIFGALTGIAAFFGAVDEHVLPARRLGFNEPDHVHLRHRADLGLEGRRLLRSRPLPAADPRNPVAPGQDFQVNRAAARPTIFGLDPTHGRLVRPPRPDSGRDPLPAAVLCLAILVAPMARKNRSRGSSMFRTLNLLPFLPLAGRAPMYGRLLWALATDPRVPVARKALLGLAGAYIVSPIDLIPDRIPFVGAIDDVAVMVLAIDVFLDGLPETLINEKLVELGHTAVGARVGSRARAEARCRGPCDP